MSGRYDEDNGMDVWVTGKDDASNLTFRVKECTFCGEQEPCLHVTEDYIDISVCQDCLGKMFDAFATFEVPNGRP